MRKTDTRYIYIYRQIDIDIDIDRQIQIQIDEQIYIYIWIDINGYIDRQTARQLPRQIEKQIDRQIDRYVDRQIDRQIDRPQQPHDESESEMRCFTKTDEWAGNITRDLKKKYDICTFPFSVLKKLLFCFVAYALPCPEGGIADHMVLDCADLIFCNKSS